MSCVECHHGNEDKTAKTEAHKGMIANPSDFTGPGFVCGRCHREEAARVNRTLMSTAAGIINQTRFLWGAQPDVSARYGTRDVDALQTLPNMEDSGALADDLLRRRCLRCHLGTTLATGSAGITGDSGKEATNETGPRATIDNPPAGAGCAACHVLKTGPAAGIGPDQKPLALGERGISQSCTLSTAIPTSQCLQCHNSNYAGSDYAGLFERDNSLSYNFEATDPEAPPILMKNSYHYLLPDIHYERGLHCIDCHPSEELMGEGKIHPQSQLQVGVRCQDCHGSTGKGPRIRRVMSSDLRALKAAKANDRYSLQLGCNVIETSGGHLLTNTVQRDGTFFLTSKVDGRVHRIPVLGREASGTEPLNHRIPGHLSRMECSACHAAWTFQDMGLHLVRLDFPDYEPWNFISRQGDPQAFDLLETNLSKPRQQWSSPASHDWLTGISKPGIWLAGYSMRRWEGRILGINARGLVSVMRPQHQYWVSWLGPQGQVLMDSRIPRISDGRPALAWNPYTPHTARTVTADCWDCHGNTRALGQGQTIVRSRDGLQQRLGGSESDGLGIDFDLDRLIDSRGQALQVSSRIGAGFLGIEQIERMSAENPLYVKYLLEFFKGKEAYGDPAGFTGPKR
jgi:hypothetical protein